MAHDHIAGLRILKDIFGNGSERLVGRSLVEFVPQGRTIETVQAEESSLLSKRTARITLHELLEIGLCSVVVLEVVVAQAPVISYGVISLGSICKYRQRLEKGCGLTVFLIVEIFECSLVFCISIIAVEKEFILRLAG